MSDKQLQKSGDNSNQIQAGTIIVNNGITEERARAIYAEMSQKAIAENTTEALEIANNRIAQLEKIVVPKIEMIDKSFESFSDPSFQVLLKKAQLTSACTDREIDYKILSELLVHRINNRGNIKKKASIAKAIEIIDQIDDDSLLASTLFLVIQHYTPNTGNISAGLKVLSNLYEKFDLDNLPQDDLWMDNLSILGAATVNPIVSLKKYDIYLSEQLSGYVCAGIKKDSEEYSKAIDMLNKCKLPEGFLVDNELCDGYVRLLIANLHNVKNWNFKSKINIQDISIPIEILLNKTQKDCVRLILDMYTTEPSKISQVKDNFNILLSSFPSIKKASAWWDSIKCVISLTSVGKVIAHTNAKSIDNSLPDLD